MPTPSRPWLKRLLQRPPRPRHLVQLLLLAITLVIGLRFWLFVRQFQPAAAGAVPALAAPRMLAHGRPVGVEAFLPIGALVALKAWLASGWWDPIHPAALVFLLTFGGLAWLFKRGFCSWLCPVGTLSEALARLGRWLFGRNLKPPQWLDRLLLVPKYLLLLFFVNAVWAGMTGETARQFLTTPYWLTADVKMLRFFQAPSLLTLQILVVLVLLSVLVEGFWCRYLCPYGALLGLASVLSPFTIRRNPQSCTDCGLCDRVCPARLSVSQSRSIRSPECTGCLDCLAACPARKKGALALALPGITTAVRPNQQKSFSAGFSLGLWSYAAALLGVFGAAILLAQTAGHWQTALGPDDLARLIPFVDSFGH